MAVITRSGNLLIAAKDNNFEILNTDTGKITNRWGLPESSPNRALWSSVKTARDYWYWLSFVEKGYSSLYRLWKEWRDKGVVIYLPPYRPFETKSDFDYVRAMLAFMPPRKLDFGEQDAVSFNKFEDKVKELFFGYDNTEGYRNDLFSNALAFAGVKDAHALYDLMEREKTTEFWAENADSLRHYILYKRQHNGYLEGVRDLWRDYSTTLRNVICAQTQVRGLLEDM